MNKEPQDFVRCRVCGSTFQFLSPNHLKTHGMDYDEYADYCIENDFKPYIRSKKNAKKQQQKSDPTLTYVTKNAIIKDLKNSISEKSDDIIDIEHYKENGNYSHTTVEDKFGSWSNAVISANLKPKKPGPKKASLEISKEEILEDVERVANQVEGSLTSKDYSRLGSYSKSIVYNYFDSWEDLEEELDIDVFKKMSAEDLIEEIREVFEEHGKLSKRDFDEKSHISVKMAEWFFGSWSNAVEEAGYEPRKSSRHPDNKVSEEDLIQDVKSLIQSKGIEVSSNDYKRYGSYGLGSIYRYFDSWKSLKQKAKERL